MRPAGKIAVTGGAGYVGSVVASHLLRSGFDVVVVDRLAAGAEALLGFTGLAGFTLVTGDVRDAKVLATAFDGVSAVVHLAAIVGEPACLENPAVARAINLDGTRSVIEGMRKSGVPHLVYLSTCSNYGVSDPSLLADEDFPLKPLGIYAQSKVEAELLALEHQGGASVRVLRLGTICGLSSRMRFDLLVNEMARAAALGESIQIFAPDAWRPFLHIRDGARAIEWAIQAADPSGSRRVFNVVGENYQKKGLVDLVRRHYPSASIQVTDKIPDARDYRATGARIEREGGFKPLQTVEDAFLEVARAVKNGAFRDPHWSGHSAAPVPKE